MSSNWEPKRRKFHLVQKECTVDANESYDSLLLQIFVSFSVVYVAIVILKLLHCFLLENFLSSFLF